MGEVTKDLEDAGLTVDRCSRRSAAFRRGGGDDVAKKGVDSGVVECPPTPRWTSVPRTRPTPGRRRGEGRPRAPGAVGWL